MREDRTEVLVVGAGPVGLWTALLLSEAGIETVIVDRETRTAAHSYACALHPRTLKSLERFGLTAPLLDLGRKIPIVAFYDHATRQAELDLGKLGGEFPFLLVVPQNALEDLLEQRLRRAGVPVRWNHRFDSVNDETEGVTATIEELEGTAVGYIVPHWETMVKQRGPVHAQFLLGADGHNSLVRQRLNLDYQRVAGPAFFAAYEFQSDQAGRDEIRVVLDDATTNVLWPLPQNRFRWTFQIVRSETDPAFPEKERRSARLARSNVDEQIRDYVHRVARQRAPWFTTDLKEITWCTQVAFEQRVAAPFGRGRCWLLGDAAHQTGPTGVQSMNAGFAEAEAIVPLLKKVLRERESPRLLEMYGAEQLRIWKRLLGVEGGLKPRPDTRPWVGNRCSRLLSCLPAVKDELGPLAGQLGLDVG